MRYADDFVVLCKSEEQAKEALVLVEAFLSTYLELKLCPIKSHVTTFSEGFDINSKSVTMRHKSIEKFKHKIRELTCRSYNLDSDRIMRVNLVIRGTANYFATPFSHNRRLFIVLDKWIQVRLRCMKFNRKWKTDNRRLRLKHFRNRGLLNLRDFYQKPV